MSRMGNKPIVLGKAELSVDGAKVTVSGPRGVLGLDLPEGVTVAVDGGVAHVGRAGDDRRLKMKHGLVRSLLNAMVTGVTDGFRKELELSGVGYRGQVADGKLTLNIGYSNPVVYDVPEGVKLTMADQTHITLESIDKQLVGQAAADIRRFRVPDAYHGKGVRFVGEQLVLKEGKTV